ncbi:MarR family transcriptional regulator [Vibrio sp. SCSIO 43135]|nr:MarR family transcriptional regulator [Vibrio sp. SCSIO 43135]USD41653.1 MarR family transcriptional regulator [Vibrio sp. SCSIO 43135]
MALESNLEKLERFSSKVWRKYSKEDPLCHLSFNEYDYLKVVQCAPEPIRLTDLASEMEVSKPSASNMVKRLERKGLVARIDCEQDARSKRFVLTKTALEHLSYETKVYQIIAEKVSKGLESAEVEQLNTLLNKVLKHYN